ncbi:MAG TPA: hypothetical protein EYP23_01935, partial [Thermoplasmata archaeon]|nr:hypothetical protein [Thermoplasmata archaeon]
MEKLRTVKILKFHPGRCTGCKECEKACSQIHFKTKEGGDRSAIHITKDGNMYNMNVCDHCGLCMDVC